MYHTDQRTGHLKKSILSAVCRHHVASHIAIGQETQISIYYHKWSTSFCKAILMQITPVQEHCTEKLYKEFDWIWARNVGKRSKYLFTHMSEVQLSMNWFWRTSTFQITVWRNHTLSDWNRARYIENRSKYLCTHKVQHSIHPL